MKKRLSAIAACVTALGLVIMCGPSCMSSSAHPAASSVAEVPSTADSTFQFYVTPDCQAVQETLHDILGTSPYEPSQTGFNDIRDWIADNIDYKSDEEQWGEDYWQSSEETLLLRTGDCEDFSILLCSLLRAYGIDAQQVFVALGDESEGEGHAFVIENWGEEGNWRRVEPQAPALPSSFTWLETFETDPDAELDKYAITAAFNDVYYYDDNNGSFSWMEGQANVWTLAGLIAIVSDAVKAVSETAQYLLGLLFT
jgi:predicted transglutaminase-like cysteine proteinase